MKIILFSLFFVIFNTAISQDVVEIYPEKILHNINPLIYGSNQTLLPKVTTAMRLGGNRMTGYNWVNNYSNAGEDWYHSNDTYMPWIMNIPEVDYEKTGIVLTEFHKRNIENNCYSLITLPMAGFVARDNSGSVGENELAPSKRWAMFPIEKIQNLIKIQTK
jgi:mannan endo-1,4-beta-mannosidase